MGGGNPYKDTWDKVTNSQAGQIAVPIVAGYVTGGLAGGAYGVGGAGTGAVGTGAAAGQTAGAAGGAAAIATAGAIASDPVTGEPLAPPDLATVNDPSAVDRALRHKQRLAAAAGRGSTFLTGPQGLGNSGTGGGKTLLGM